MRPVLADAAEVARRALVALEPDGVGVHLGVSAEDDTAATHRFEATLPGYRGWQWAVVVAAPPGADHATVSESALLPALDALIAPDFIPWDQRVRPGDLGPGDLLATPADDPRLVPGYVATGDPVATRWPARSASAACRFSASKVAPMPPSGGSPSSAPIPRWPRPPRRRAACAVSTCRWPAPCASPSASAAMRWAPTATSSTSPTAVAPTPTWSPPAATDRRCTRRSTTMRWTSSTSSARLSRRRSTRPSPRWPRRPGNDRRRCRARDSRRRNGDCGGCRRDDR